MQSLGESDGGELRAAVRQEVRHADLSADRRDVHDPSMSLTLHHRQDGQRRVDDAPVHDVHQRVVVVDAHRRRGADFDDAGVVDQDVDAAKRLHRRFDQVRDLIGTGHVAHDRHHRRRSQSRQFLGCLAQFTLFAGADHDPATGAGELAGDVETESARAAGDDGDLSFQRLLAQVTGEGAGGDGDGGDCGERGGCAAVSTVKNTRSGSSSSIRSGRYSSMRGIDWSRA